MASSGAWTGAGGGIGDVEMEDANTNTNNPNVFNHLVFLQNHFQRLRDSGANVAVEIPELVVHTRPGVGGSIYIPGNINTDVGDSNSAVLRASELVYHTLSGMSGSIDMPLSSANLVRNIPGNSNNSRSGTPPASSSSSINGLPVINITEELLHLADARCTVCMENFEVGQETKQMPCRHVFHPGCILPWLVEHRSCPVCRHRLDDELESGDNSQTPQTPQTTQTPQTVMMRQITIPLPYSGSGSGNNNTNNNLD